MYKVLCLNKISPVGTKRFGEAYTFSPEMENPQGILVRSASMHDMELGENLLAIARAGAGVNNIPVDACTEKGIVVFNTPGANANAVKELAVAGLLLGVCAASVSMALLCALCSFGGLSIWLQNLLFVPECIRPAKLLCVRMLHGALSGGLALLVFTLFPGLTRPF